MKTKRWMNNDKRAYFYQSCRLVHQLIKWKKTKSELRLSFSAAKIVVDRFEQEWKRTNDLDSKASNVTGFAGLLATLSGGITAGIAEILPQMHYKYLFIIPLIVFVLSALFGLLAYWLTDFSAIDPEAVIREYKNRKKNIRNFLKMATATIITNPFLFWTKL